MSWREEYKKHLETRQGPLLPGCFLDQGDGTCAKPVIQEDGGVRCGGSGDPSRCKFSPFRTGSWRGEVGGPKKTRIFDGGSMTH